MKGYFTGKPLPKEPEKKLQVLALNRYKISGISVWEDRAYNLPELEAIIYKSICIRKKLSKQWGDLYNICHPMTHIQGYIKGTHYYLEANDDGISFKVVHEKNFEDDEKIKLLPDEDLPIYVGRENELNNKEVKLLKDRLKGPKESGNKKAVVCPIRNDLISNYLYLKGRFSTTNKVYCYCKNIIKGYISDKYSYFYSKYKYEEVLIDLILNGRTYTIIFKPNTGFDIIKTPDSVSYTDIGDKGEYTPNKYLIH